jgi:hypothetical protein
LFAAMVVAAVAVLGLPSVSFAATTYSISGHVDLDGATSVPAGLGDVTAIASTSATLPVQSAGSVDTDDSGNFTVTGLAPGTYYMYFRYNGSAGYRSAWAGEMPYATTAIRAVKITSSNVTQIAWDLFLPTTISGQVTLGAAATVAGAGEVMVSYATQSSLNSAWNAESTPISTDAHGDYSFPNIDPGYYRLYFQYAGTGAYESEYLGFRASPVANDAIALKAYIGGPFTENIDLPDLLRIHGHISIGTAATSASAAQVTVSLDYYDPNGNGGWTPLPGVSDDTDASGNYLFTGLVNFDYKVVATYNGTGNYLSTTTLAVPDAGSPSLTQDVVVPAVHSASGHVSLGTSARSATSGEVEVEFYNNAYNYSATVLTDANGNYSLTGLPEGSYYVTLHYVGTGAFVDTLLFFPECDNTCSFKLTSDRTDIDGTVRVANAVSGTVLTWDGAPLSGIKIAAKEYDPNTGVYVGEIDTTSGSNGSYSFASLPNGKYEFDVTDPHGGYASTVIDAAPNRLWLNNSQPTAVPIISLMTGETVSGSVTIVGGSAADIAGGAATVQLMSQSITDGAWTDSGQTFPITLSGGTDRFAITGVPYGAYKLRYDYHGVSGDAVSFSSEVFVDPSNPLIVPTVSLYPEHPASTVSDFSITGDVGAIGVRGWAAWPSSLGTSVGLAVNIGSSWYPVTANQSNTYMDDVDTLGTNHGFSWSFPASLAEFNVCLWTTEPSGPAEILGCSTVFPQPPSPTTYALDSLTGSTAGVSVAGWAQYPDFPSSSVGVALNIGSSWYGFTANQANTDTGAGTNHGYSGTVPLAPGTYSVCVWVTEPAGGAANTGCHPVVVPAPARAVVHSDSVTGGLGSLTVTGWDVYPDSLATHVGMALQIGASWYGFTANVTNAEVPVAYPAVGADHGYADTLALAPGTYSACIWTTEPSGPAVDAGCHSVVVTAPHPAAGAVDAVTGGVGTVSIAGWEAWPDSLGTQVGLAAQVGSSWYGFTANTVSSEAAAAYPASVVNHGYSTSLALPPGSYSVCIWTTEQSGPAVNTGCHSVTVTAPPPAVTSFDTATAVTGGIQVTGYSEFPASLGTSVGVAAQIGTHWFGFTANGSNATAPGHGFTGFIAEAHGSYSVCMWTVEPSGAALGFGCKSVTVP